MDESLSGDCLALNGTTFNAVHRVYRGGGFGTAGVYVPTDVPLPRLRVSATMTTDREAVCDYLRKLASGR